MNGTQATEATALVDSGTLLLKVNPEIAIEYDENGKVTGITGKNEDGTEIVDQYPDYIGKDSGEVLEELIALIGEAGYFVDEVEGEAKRIVIELEEGSALPGDHFLEAMAASAQHAVEEYKLSSNVEVEGDTYISIEEAKAIAFEHAGVDGSNAQFDDQEFDHDDGVPSYELEFMIEGTEYEYDIHAVSGEILENEIDEERTGNKEPVENKEHKENNARKDKSKAPAKEKPQEKKEAYISLDEAKQIAFNHAGANGANARFDDQELDEEDGVPSYELEFDINGNEYEYDIQAVSGEILEAEIEEVSKNTAEPKEKKETKTETTKEEKAEKKHISLDEAKRIALEHAGVNGSNARFDDQELEEDDGVLVYELEFEVGEIEYEYEIHAISGAILEHEQDD